MKSFIVCKIQYNEDVRKSVIGRLLGRRRSVPSIRQLQVGKSNQITRLKASDTVRCTTNVYFSSGMHCNPTVH